MTLDEEHEVVLFSSVYRKYHHISYNLFYEEQSMEIVIKDVGNRYLIFHMYDLL